MSSSLFSTTQQPQQRQQPRNPFLQQTDELLQPFHFNFPQQCQQQQQQQQELCLYTSDKTPATYTTKWSDLHPDSQNALFKIENTILEYREESQRLDQCSRLFDTCVLNDALEVDRSCIIQELGGISSSMERQKVVIEELMAVAKDMLRNAETAVRSFTMCQQKFLHQKASTGSDPSAASGDAIKPATKTLLQAVDFCSETHKKPTPFMLLIVDRFEKYLGDCRQQIEKLEQLLLSDSIQNSISFNSSVLQSLPKVLTIVNDFFLHVAATVESIHQFIESMRLAYLADQRDHEVVSDPFSEADQRETAKLEAIAKRLHPTLHLPAPPQPTTQGTPAIATYPQTSESAPFSSDLSF